jgi:toxin ParE1/3/4
MTSIVTRFNYQLRPDIGSEARMATVGIYAILFRVTSEVVRIERVDYGGRDLVGVFESPRPR